MTTWDFLERKLQKAEAKAWKVIQGHGLPTRLDGHGETLADLDDLDPFRNASAKDKRRIVDARNVLISAREVRDRIDRDDIAGALNYARYVEQDADLLEDARRGAGVTDKLWDTGSSQGS